MGFEKIPERQEPKPVAEKHFCEDPPQRLPDGGEVPTGTTWRCDICGKVQVANIIYTWYGILIANIFVLPWSVARILAHLLTAKEVFWTPRRLFFGFWAVLWGIGVLAAVL